MRKQINMKLLHEELTYKLRGCFYEVHNSINAGYDEECYHLALVECLKKYNIPFESKVKRILHHRGQKIYTFIADLVIDNKVILELKSISKDFAAEHFLQGISYLKCWQLDLGMLVNFGQLRVNVERILFSEKDLILSEDYDRLNEKAYYEHQNIYEELRDSIITIFRMHGLNYSTKIYRALCQSELNHRNIPFLSNTPIPVKFEGKVVRYYDLKYPIINSKILCAIVAGVSNIDLEISKVKTYLKDLNLPIGILANFGKNELQIIGISP